MTYEDNAIFCIPSAGVFDHGVEVPKTKLIVTIHQDDFSVMDEVREIANKSDKLTDLKALIKKTVLLEAAKGNYEVLINCNGFDICSYRARQLALWLKGMKFIADVHGSVEHTNLRLLIKWWTLNDFKN